MLPLIVVVQRGDIMDYTNTAETAILPGDAVPMAAVFGVAVGDVIAAGATGAVCVNGVVEGPATSAVTYKQGDALYWDATNKAFTNVATDHTPAGYAWLAKAVGVNVAQSKISY